MGKNTDFDVRHSNLKSNPDCITLGRLIPPHLAGVILNGGNRTAPTAHRAVIVRKELL